MAGETLAGSAAAEQLARNFSEVRAATLRFTAPLSPEDMMVQSCAEASPVKWHLAHTSWFFETFVLTPFASGYKAFNPDFHWLFNSYYNALGEMPAKNLRSSFSRPGLEAIVSYRKHVDRAIDALLEQGGAAGDEDEVLRRITLGLEHEQQHLELIATDIKHALFTNPLHPAYAEARASVAGQSAAMTFREFDGGVVEIGISPDPASPTAFAFDNETPQHKVYLEPFALANRLVTAGEYLKFIEDNGYSRAEFWLSEGWTTVRAAGWESPLYWRRDGADAWSIFTLGGYKPLDELRETPVCHLSFFEADAYARWAGHRLPSEFEWEHAAATSGVTTEDANMLESGALQPLAAASTDGMQQMFGDVWEWTASGYTGYPGYKPLPGALGEYNGKFMSSQVILRGGSCVTPASHIRATYRNFFPAATRWQFSGLRLARGW